MKKKVYYSYIEIILGLRKEYQKNQRLLEELNRLISVESKNDVDKELYIYQKKSLPILYLKISKKQNEIKEIYNRFLSRYNNVRYEEENAILELNEKDNNLVFHDPYILRNSSKFNPQVSITNQNDFNEIYHELKESALYNSKYVLNSLNAFQLFSLDANNIRLTTNTNLSGTKHIILDYNAKYDDIEIMRNCWHSIDNYTFYELLDTQISRYILKEEYQEILDKNEDSMGILCIDSKHQDVVNGHYEITNDKRLVKKDVYY